MLLNLLLRSERLESRLKLHLRKGLRTLMVFKLKRLLLLALLLLEDRLLLVEWLLIDLLRHGLHSYMLLLLGHLLLHNDLVEL